MNIEKMLGGMMGEEENPLAGKMSIMIVKEDELDAKTNKKNRDIVIADWNYSDGTNPDYWKKMAKLWMVELSEAKRQRCSNCEYFDNKPECLEKLESIAEDSFDEVGGRGKCTKFDFIAHDVRVCQAWEEHESHKDYED
tara:strand:+ start:180 stop:596 length:417 start_codon:yes stop_codon:yes gene_type:complete